MSRRWTKRCITLVTSLQTNTLGGAQDAFVRRGFGANRDGSVMTNGLKTVLPRSFNAATSRVEVLKGLSPVWDSRSRRPD